MLTNHINYCKGNCLCGKLTFNNSSLIEKKYTKDCLKKLVKMKSKKNTNNLELISNFKTKFSQNIKFSNHSIKEKNNLVNINQVYELIDYFLENMQKLENKNEINSDYENILVKYILFLVIERKII